MIYVHVPVRTISEPNARGHWAAKYRRTHQQRNLAHLALAMKARGIVAKHAKLVVELTRVAVSGSRGLDSDNLAGSMKAIRDGVADALGIDDGSDRIEWRYAQRRGDAWAVEIRIGTPSEMAA